MRSEIDTAARLLWDYLRFPQPLVAADAVLALGSNAIRVGEYAADLVRQGYGRYLIVSGGNGADSVFTRPEADIYADIARTKGIPDDRILVERASVNTSENIAFTRALLEEKGVEVRSLIVVQKPYLERRVFATFQKQWPEVSCIVASPPIPYEGYAKDEASRDRLAQYMMGTLYRIKAYPLLGYQVPQEIPDAVEHAYALLYRQGYTTYVTKEHASGQ